MEVESCIEQPLDSVEREVYGEEECVLYQTLESRREYRRKALLLVMSYCTAFDDKSIEVDACEIVE